MRKIFRQVFLPRTDSCAFRHSYVRLRCVYFSIIRRRSSQPRKVVVQSPSLLLGMVPKSKEKKYNLGASALRPGEEISRGSPWKISGQFSLLALARVAGGLSFP